jgi:hypothetical protein
MDASRRTCWRLLLALLVAGIIFATPASARPVATEGSEHAEATVTLGRGAALPSRDIDFYGWWHDTGELLLHISNLAFVGDWDSADGEPSAEWPGASGFEHLYAAGLWVGARAAQDTLVSAAAYSQEFWPPLEDPVYIIYEGSESSVGGLRLFDDDGDGAVDEERLDGIDNDGDGFIDEDYAGISEQMFARVCFDTLITGTEPPNDPHHPIGLEVFEQSFAWSVPYIDDFVGIRYEITNAGTTTYEEVFVGFMADPDVGLGADEVDNYLDDTIGYVDEVLPWPTGDVEPTRVVMAYSHDTPGGDDGDWDGYIGFVLLNHTTDPSGVSAPSSFGPRACRMWWSGADDPRVDADRWQLLHEPVFSATSAEPHDWRCLLSTGPYNELAPGETLVLEVGVVCGRKLGGLVRNAAVAAHVYEGYYDKVAGQQVHWSPGNPYGGVRRSEEAALSVGGLAPRAGTGTLRLSPPMPNPANAGTAIVLSMPEAEHASVSVYDVAGRRVAVLIDDLVQAGQHRVFWDTRSDDGNLISSGIYFIRVTAGLEEHVEKVVIAR